MSNAIVVESVRKNIGAFSVLKGVSFSVPSGEVVAILGPSGSGKTTLIRAIAGLEKYDGGNIRLEGEVGVLFQNFHLFPHLTVLENITLAPRVVRGKDVSVSAMAWLSKLKVAEQATKYPRQLSGGQQQRVAMARALVMEPKVMLFDEPTSALDPEAVADVLDAINDLASTGMTLVVVTHQMGFARKVADRIVFLDHGEVLENSPPEEFFNSPKQEKTRQFLAKVLRY